jgi:hypothetical protein
MQCWSLLLLLLLLLLLPLEGRGGMIWQATGVWCLCLQCSTAVKALK